VESPRDSSQDEYGKESDDNVPESELPTVVVEAERVTKASAVAEVVRWDQQSSRKEVTDSRGRIEDMQRKKKHEEVLSALLGSQSTQYSAAVNTWDDVQNKEKIAFRQSVLRRLEPARPQRDEWDVELDKGRTKKTKERKFIDAGASNVFQSFLDSGGKEKILHKFKNPGQGSRGNVARAARATGQGDFSSGRWD